MVENRPLNVQAREFKDESLPKILREIADRIEEEQISVLAINLETDDNGETVTLVYE